jgi:integrase
VAGRRRRPSTVRDYRIVVDRVLVPALGEAPIEAITSGHIDAFRAALVEEGRLSPRTINKYLALIHGILKRAQRVYGLSANAAAGVERQPARRSCDFDVLSAAEVEALVRAASSSQDAALFATAAYAGLRLGELRALRCLDLDFEKRLVHVRRSYVERAERAPKSGRVRSVPMIDQVATVLDQLSRREWFTGENDLVFCNDVGDHFDDSALRRRFYSARSAAGLKRIRFHESEAYVRHARRPGLPAFRRQGLHGPRGHCDDNDLRPLRAAVRRGGSPVAGAARSSGHRIDFGHRCAPRGRCSRMKVRDVIRVLEAHGWHLDRQRGGHRIFRHETRPGTVTVAGKPNTDIPPGTLGSIRRQSGLEDELR